MTEPLCGQPHHRYPETLCAEPAGHYVRDRDPHAGPLIIDGRQRGGAAWDEPKDTMPDRHTVDSITSDALDALYERLANAETQRDRFEAAWQSARQRAAEQRTLADIRQRRLRIRARRIIELEQLAEEAEAAIERMREAVDRLKTYRRAAAALEEPPAPAATEATDTETTTRVFAALHQSAEQDVSRVIGLYERWVKAGLPPLGTILARWWDARLVELHDAIRPPADGTREQP